MKRSQSKVIVKSEQKTEEPNSKKVRNSEAVEVKIDIKEEISNGEHDRDTEIENANAAAVNFVVKKEERKKCPYLDTVNRQLLDFDMEKVCSVTLSNLNVYCCLICGKYFQGRGKSTPAYTHSVASGKFCIGLIWFYVVYFVFYPLFCSVLFSFLCFLLQRSVASCSALYVLCLYVSFFRAIITLIAY
jgi:hypothetical protein